jgi:hypothetical protein
MWNFPLVLSCWHSKRCLFFVVFFLNLAALQILDFQIKDAPFILAVLGVTWETLYTAPNFSFCPEITDKIPPGYKEAMGLEFV